MKRRRRADTKYNKFVFELAERLTNPAEEPRTAYVIMIELSVSKLVAKRLCLVCLDVWMKGHILDAGTVIGTPDKVKFDLST